MLGSLFNLTRETNHRMAQERLSMRKIREILRLRFDAKLSMERIALGCKVSSSTVSDTLTRFKLSGLVWPLDDVLDDGQLEERLYRDRHKGKPPDAHVPDWHWVHRELRKGKNVTLAGIWEEYKNEHPGGYNYSWFCESYAKFRGHVDPVMRQVHKMGEKCFVDYAGPTFNIVDRHTGEVRTASLFVGVLGGSNYTFVEATWSQGLPDWLGSHVRMLEFFGGAPEIVVPDNLKCGVTKPNYYEPDINVAYSEWAQHYGIAVIPARVRKPKDKSKAENGVLLAERWIMAVLRNRTFYQLDELNEAIEGLLDRLNRRQFQKLNGSRLEMFEKLEKPTLRPLPSERYYYSQWKKARVHIDYHVELDGHYYSVPHELIHELLQARLTTTVVELLHNGRRVTSHRRSYVQGGRTTLREHMPSKHSKMLEWTPERLTSWASKNGPATRDLVAGIMAKWPHPQQGFRACLGVLNLSKKYSSERVEAACRRALIHGAYSYHSVKSILEKGMDKLIDTTESTRPSILHENVRGAAYYAGSEN
jgi:transposase